MLTWRTPLQQQLTSDCLSVTRNGNKIPYDGIMMKRSTPGPDQFLLVAAGQTVSSTFDVSEGYGMSKTGMYSIAVDTYIEYAEGSVEGMNEPGKPGIPIKISHLSSPLVSFKVVGRKAGKGTQGYRARSIERGNRRTMSVRRSCCTGECCPKNTDKGNSLFFIPLYKIRHFRSPKQSRPC